MSISLEPTDYAHLFREKKSGIYYARIDVNNKTVRKSLGTKELTEAIAALAVFLQTNSSGSLQIKKMSWLAAVETYKAQQNMRPELKPRALESVVFFADRAKKMIKNDMSAEEITPNMCRKWWKEEATSISPRTANGTLGAVKKIFALLSKIDAIKSDPTKDLSRLTVKQKNLNIPSKEDFSKIVNEIREATTLRPKPERRIYLESADFISFLAYSGLRIEEARRLEWKDIGKESISVPDIKHATARRTLYINPSLQKTIESIREHHFDPHGTNKVFSINSPKKALGNACKRLKIAHVRIHDLRHFFATTCIEAGIDIPTVAKWLGHRDGGALAMKVYGHLRDDHSKAQAAKLNFD